MPALSITFLPPSLQVEAAKNSGQSPADQLVRIHWLTACIRSQLQDARFNELRTSTAAAAAAAAAAHVTASTSAGDCAAAAEDGALLSPAASTTTPGKTWAEPRRSSFE